MKLKIGRAILLALNACGGLPMPESALFSAVENLIRPERATRSDIEDALGGVEGNGYVQGVSEDMEERTWTLTEKGVHKARQLR